MNTVVVAYSGGLDTNYCVKYLQSEGFEVVTATVDTGGFSDEELVEIEQMAIRAGAARHFVVDAVDDVYNRFGTYIIKGNILRGGVYPLVVGAERVIQAEKIVEIAKEVGATAIAHGSTGAGNDQVRFDVTVNTLAPDLKIIAPIREQHLSREAEVEYLEAHDLPIAAERKTYSINQGMFGVTIGGGATHDAWEEIPDEAYVLTKSLAEVPNDSKEIVLEFAQGVPIGINGVRQSGREILSALNTIGGAYGFGRGVHVGDTILGIKGRIAFEAPGMLSLIAAHRELEKVVLTKHQLEWKQMTSQMYGSYLHEARWYDPLMRDWEAFIDSSQRRVEGEVRLKFVHGHCFVSGVRSSYALLSTGTLYGEESSLWDGKEAAGFSKIYGVGSALAYRSSLTQNRRKVRGQ